MAVMRREAFKIMTILSVFYVAASQSGNSFSGEDPIVIKTLEWKKSSVGTLFIVTYEADEKPQIVWGTTYSQYLHDSIYPILTPRPGSVDYWINSFSNSQGILILQVLDTFADSKRYILLSFSNTLMTLNVQIDRNKCLRKGTDGIDNIESTETKINPFGNGEDIAGGVVMNMTSKQMLHFSKAIIYNLDMYKNDVSATTAVYPKFDDRTREEGVYLYQFELARIPADGILAVKYTTSSLSTTCLQSAGAVKRMFLGKAITQHNMLSFLTPDMETETVVPISDVGYIRCVGIGNPPPSVTFSKGNRRIRSDQKYNLKLGNVVVANLKIQDFSAADDGAYTCSLRSGRKESNTQLEAIMGPRILKGQSKATKVLRNKVRVVCVAEGQSRLNIEFDVVYKDVRESFRLNTSRSYTHGTEESVVTYSVRNLSRVKKSATLAIENSNTNLIERINCVASDSGRAPANVYPVLIVREFAVNTEFKYEYYPLTTAKCTAEIETDHWEDTQDDIKIKWYRNKISPEDEIKENKDTIIVSSINEDYSPQSYIMLMNETFWSVNYTLLCRATSRFTDHNKITVKKV